MTVNNHLLKSKNLQRRDCNYQKPQQSCKFTTAQRSPLTKDFLGTAELCLRNEACRFQAARKDNKNEIADWSSIAFIKPLHLTKQLLPWTKSDSSYFWTVLLQTKNSLINKDFLKIMLFKIFIMMNMFPPDESYSKSKTFSCTTYTYI